MITLHDPQAVFKAVIEEHGDWIKAYMYMHSEGTSKHAFKHPVSRKYITVSAELKSE